MSGQNVPGCEFSKPQDSLMLEAGVLGADVFSLVQGSPAKLQGALSIPLRTANPVTAKFQHNYFYECKNYLFSKPFHLDLTSGLRSQRSIVSRSLQKMHCDQAAPMYSHHSRVNRLVRAQYIHRSNDPEGPAFGLSVS